MCRRNLFICHTPFQVITSIIIKQSKYPDDYADIILSSAFQNYKIIGERCKATEIFEHVFTVSLTKTNCTIGPLIPYYFTKDLENYFPDTYDRIFTNGPYYDLDNSVFYKFKNAEVIVYDEGYSTYTNDFLRMPKKFSFRHRIIRNLSQFIFNRTYMETAAKKIMLYDPELCVKPLPYSIEKIWDKNHNDAIKIMKAISYVFNVTDAISEYNKKYIFFEECFASDFQNNGDIEIIRRIISIVGSENLIVKLHPRDKTNRFIDLGISTNQTISVPNEALVTEMQNQGKVFITFSSGGVLNYRFLCDCSIKTILLYKLLPSGFITMPEDRLQWFEKFLKKYHENLFAPKTFEELEKLLEAV